MTFVMSGLALVVLIEAFFSWKNRSGVYRLPESLSHLKIAGGQQLVNILAFPALAFIYNALFNRFAPFKLDQTNLFHWCVTILACDFCFYWAHRTGHRVAFFVATHSVHHQTKDFNHLSAFRHSIFNRIVNFVFYLPLLLIGAPIEMISIALVINLSVQFWSHNGSYKKDLKFINKVFVTPRFHYLHHGTNAPFLDKNYGGLFSFWDNLFGTAISTDDLSLVEVGPKEPEVILDLIPAHSHYFRKIYQVSSNENSTLRKLKTWFLRPEIIDLKWKVQK